MKIIILRHGNRFDSTLYFTPLTALGLKQADNLITTLQPHNIDIIYSSPFLRVLQTIYPFCEETNKKVNIENSFYESLDSNEFNYHNYRHRPSELESTYPHLTSIINDHYKSHLFVSNISYIEKEKEILNRVFPFIYNLCQKHRKKDTTILIVTHGTIFNAIKKFFKTTVLLTDEVSEAIPYIIDVPVDVKSPVGYL